MTEENPRLVLEWRHAMCATLSEHGEQLNRSPGVADRPRQAAARFAARFGFVSRAASALTRVLVGAASVLVVPAPAAAEVNRCTNATGEVYYTDQACAGDYVKQDVDIKSGPPNAAPAADNPYSVINQARTIERREASQRRRLAMARIASSADDQSALARVQEALSGLDRDERNLQAELGGSPLRAQWAQEDLSEIKSQRAELVRTQEGIQVRLNQAAVARANADVAEAQARAEAAERRARDAEAQAQARVWERHAQALDWQAQEREREARERAHEAQEAARERNKSNNGTLQ